VVYKFLCSVVASFPKEDVHLGSFVPENPIAEPGPVMDNGMVSLHLHRTNLALSILRCNLDCKRAVPVLYREKDQISYFRSCAVWRLGKKYR